MSRAADDAAVRGSSLVALEIAAAGAVAAAIVRETDPPATLLLREAKVAHQENAGQLLAALRASGHAAAPSASPAEPLMKGAAAISEWVSIAAGLRLLRETASLLRARHDELARTSGGLVSAAASRCADRLALGHGLLTAHLAQRSGGDELRSELPLPLDRYFATGTWTCLRCHLDRPGSRPAVRRAAPHQHACAGCHDDVVASLPPDLAAEWPSWSEESREEMVLERAASHPSKAEARLVTLPPLFGLAAQPRTRLSDDVPAARAAFPRKAPAGALPTLQEIGEGRSEAESAYLATLFSPERLRRAW